MTPGRIVAADDLQRAIWPRLGGLQECKDSARQTQCRKPASAYRDDGRNGNRPIVVGRLELRRSRCTVALVMPSPVHMYNAAVVVVSCLLIRMRVHERRGDGGRLDRQRECNR
jgi:hypothetical protein